MDQEETQTLTCKECRRDFPADAPGKQIVNSWTCRHCESMKSMIHRHLGTLDKAGFNHESRTEFFRKTAALQCGGDRYSWQAVRSTIVATRTKQTLSEQRNEVSASALPLGVWLARGYAEDVVRQFWSETCPLQGDLYKVPVKTTTIAHLEREIYEELLQQERQAKEAKGKKRAPEDGQPDMDIATMREEPAPKTRKGAAEAADKQKLKTEQRQRELARKQNEKTALFAAQQVSPLSTCVASLEKLQAQGEKAKVEMDLLNEVRLTLDKLHPWLKACKNVGQLADATQDGAASLPSLDFSKEDVKVTLKAATSLMNDLRGNIKHNKKEAPKAEAKRKPERKPKAKAKGAAAPAKS